MQAFPCWSSGLICLAIFLSEWPPKWPTVSTYSAESHKNLQGPFRNGESGVQMDADLVHESDLRLLTLLQLCKLLYNRIEQFVNPKLSFLVAT